MRIALTVDGLLLPAAEGATARFVETARTLTELGHEVTIIHCYRGWSDRARMRREPYRIELVHPTDFYRGTEVWRALLDELDLDVLQTHEESLLHSLFERDLLPGGAAVVYECHNFATYAADARTLVEAPSAQRRFACALADGIVCLTERDAAAIRGLAPAVTPPIVVPCSIAEVAPPSVRREGSGHRLVFLGHLYYEPNAEALRWIVADIFPRIRARVADAELHVAGHGPGSLRAECARDGVVWHGYVDDVASLLGECDLALSPLRRGSGFRVKTLAYVAAGLATVGTPEGLFGVGEGDAECTATDPAALADLAVRLLTDGEARARAAARGWATLQGGHTSREVYARYDALADLGGVDDPDRFRRRFAALPPDVVARVDHELALVQAERPPWLAELVRKRRFRSMLPPFKPGRSFAVDAAGDDADLAAPSVPSWRSL